MSGLSLVAGLLGLMKQECIFPLVFSPVPAKVACSVAGAASQPGSAHKYLNLSDFQPLLSSIWTLFQGHWAIGRILIYIRLKHLLKNGLWPYLFQKPVFHYSLEISAAILYTSGQMAWTQRLGHRDTLCLPWNPVPHSTDVHISSSDMPCDCLLPLSPLASN